MFFFVAPTLLILSALGEPLFRFLFTEKWLPAVPYFQILCWAGILYPIHAYNLNILKVKGRSDLFLKLEIIKKIIIVIVIGLSISYGVLGLLYGSVVISVIAFFINTYYSGKFINYSTWQQTKDIFPAIAIAFFATFIVYSSDNYLKSQLYSDVIRLGIGALFGGIIFFLVSSLFKLNAINELKMIIKKQ